MKLRKAGALKAFNAQYHRYAINRYPLDKLSHTLAKGLSGLTTAWAHATKGSRESPATRAAYNW